MKLKMLLGDYTTTHGMRSGEIKSDAVEFEFDTVKTINKAFPRVVNGLEFEVAELALATFIQAKAYGKPLVLLPAVIRGKLAHDMIKYNTERGRLTTADLPGRRVGIRAVAQTTPLWVRGILQNDYGVDLDRVKWVTFENSHVAEFRDPSGVERAPDGKKTREMLLAGELDAAMLSTQRDAPDQRLQPMIPDADAAGKAWYAKHGVVPINHMVVVKESFSKSHPDVVAEIFRLLAESKKASGLPKAGQPDAFTFGVEACRKALDMAIKFSVQQKLIPRAFSVDELFDDNTRKLGR
jgi:4,5-dihydroxyphthalate decarboxylase